MKQGEKDQNMLNKFNTENSYQSEIAFDDNGGDDGLYTHEYSLGSADEIPVNVSPKQTSIKTSKWAVYSEEVRDLQNI